MRERIKAIEDRLENIAARVHALECCSVSPDIIPGEYRTRDGSRAVVYTVDGLDPEFPVVGESQSLEGVVCQCWTADGHFYNDGGQSVLDLVRTSIL
jgi:hypothetical protein